MGDNKTFQWIERIVPSVATTLLVGLALGYVSMRDSTIDNGNQIVQLKEDLVGYAENLDEFDERCQKTRDLLQEIINDERQLETLFEEWSKGAERRINTIERRVFRMNGDH